ncbi:MAG: hypothetical protein ACP5JH_07190 [Bacteroidota bacterium]
MVPQVRVKLRRRKGAPFAIERLAGIQYRCRACNTVFLTREELDRHLDGESQGRLNLDPSPVAPKLGSNISVRVLYAIDVTDRLKKNFMKGEDDQYDDLWN